MVSSFFSSFFTRGEEVVVVVVVDVDTPLPDPEEDEDEEEEEDEDENEKGFVRSVVGFSKISTFLFFAHPNIFKMSSFWGSL